MKRPQTKYHAHTMRKSQVIRSKKSQNSSLGQNLSLGQNFLAAEFISLHRYFTETTTTDIDMLLQVYLQFCNNNGFVASSGVIMLFCPLLDDWIVCRISMVRQETMSYSSWFGKCSIHHTYNISTLWYSQAWLNTSTPKAELFCSCKRRKFIGQNTVKICKL